MESAMPAHTVKQVREKVREKCNLHKHIRAKHLGEKYDCPYCLYSSGWRTNFKKHIKTAHMDKTQV